MSQLHHYLTGLFEFLNGEGLTLPTENVWLVEVTGNVDMDERGRLRVQRANFHLPEVFNTRLDELISSGFPWINMSCYGLDRDRLIVLIETPKKFGSSASRTSVNFSGPTRAVLQSGWDVSVALDIR